MTIPHRFSGFFAAVVCVSVLAGCRTAPAGPGTSTDPRGPSRGMVATVHPLATKAGLDAMELGGNAVDAAVAAALTLGVVDGFNSGIGGGCFILIRTADGKLIAIDGRETAPAKATRDMFLRDRKADPGLSQTGPLAVGTPGALAGYARAVKRHGRLTLADLLLPAADIAEQGFVLDPYYARRLGAAADKLRKFEGSREIFLRPDGSTLGEGDVLVQEDLADTYRSIAVYGTRFFYEGFFAEMTGRWMFENGGVLSAEDLARYEAKDREPVVTTYRGYTVVGFPPPSSGGVHVAQILNILENFDLRAMHARDAGLFTHTVAEAMKLAFADRAHWLGDPAFANVPRGLIDKGYARRLADRIAPGHAIEVAGHGTPPGSERFDKHTTHIAAADAEGNWVAITATINTTFGSGVVVPGTGVVLNNEMDDFAAAPGVPNAFGLVGAEANAVGPGKRPLSSMSPTIILKDGEPVLTLGAAGGPRIISQVVLAAIHWLDLEMGLNAAIAAPRFHHQWRPDLLSVESTLGESLRDELERRGHVVRVTESAGVTQGITREGGVFVGVSDPRVRGSSGGR